MSVQVNFDATTVDPAQALEALPAGTYICTLTDSEQKENSSGTGHHMRMVFTVQEGEYKGRKVIETLNLWNKSEAAQEIAWREFSALCHATGVLQVQDTQQLHGQPVLLTLTVEESEQYGAQNRIKAYDAVMPGSAPQAPSTAQPPQAPAAPAAPAAPQPPPAPPAAPAAPAAPAQPQAPAQAAPPATPPAAPAGDATPPWAR
jgi:hypothetical protein